MSKIDDKLNEVLGIAEVDKTYENEVLPKKISTKIRMRKSLKCLFPNFLIPSTNNRQFYYP